MNSSLTVCVTKKVSISDGYSRVAELSICTYTRSLPAYDRALCPVLAILSGSGLVLGIIPKGHLGIPICRGNALGTSLPDPLHIVSPGIRVYNSMRCLEGSLVGIVQLLEMLLDDRIDICPALGLQVRLQVKLRLQSYTTKQRQS
ncbi:hypothetical protein Tco_0800952 [Tanacetum coccineum]|uniref:Uncharacterized protein n=1 Tax=Tanacetum coccineum TaxID=301880 RepID=A0ABQ4ZUL0_9ASTR